MNVNGTSQMWRDLRPVLFGELLFDEFSDGSSVLGGAPFNVAWHLRGFGLDPLLISRIGDDVRGEQIRRVMDTWGLDARGLQIDPARPTGVVHIVLHAGSHTFDIAPDQAYDFIDADALGGGAPGGAPGIVYHGTLALRSPRSRAALDKLSAAAVEGAVFVDLNLREPWWREADLPAWCARARWLKLNDHELSRLAEALGLSADGAARQVPQLVDEFDLELIIVTRGAQGAAAWGRDGVAQVLPPGPQIKVADTVGAGDAFAAVVLYGLRRGWGLSVVLQRAQAFASLICQQRGATVVDRAFYQTQIAEWEAA